MARLIRSHVTTSPFLEVGAERCQRSLVLTNEFGAEGIAADISLDMLDMLRYATVVADNLGYTKMPLRICCDANNLPIRDGVLPFVFCYQTLHHFPDPVPICSEIVRTLGGEGTFYVDDEPVKGLVKQLTRRYHRRGYRRNVFEVFLDRLRLLSVLSDGGDLEREYGILEGEFGLDTWLKALSVFDRTRITVNRRLRLQVHRARLHPASLASKLVGGNIEALCQISKPRLTDGSDSVIDLLHCPNCRGRLTNRQESPAGAMRCASCQRTYPNVGGVLLLFEEGLGRRLYPEHLN